MIYVLRIPKTQSFIVASLHYLYISMCAERCQGYGTGLDPGNVVRELMQLMFRHGVSMGGNYATLIVNMLCIEGLARGLEPTFNVVDFAYPLLRAHQVLGDRNFQRVFSLIQWLSLTQAPNIKIGTSQQNKSDGIKIPRYTSINKTSIFHM